MLSQNPRGRVQASNRVVLPSVPTRISARVEVSGVKREKAGPRASGLRLETLSLE